MRSIISIPAMAVVCALGAWVVFGPMAGRMVWGIFAAKWLGVSVMGLGGFVIVTELWWLFSGVPVLVADENGIHVRRVFRTVSIPWERYAGAEITEGTHGQRLEFQAVDPNVVNLSTGARTVAWIDPRRTTISIGVLHDTVEAYAKSRRSD